jgi:predicted dehydrogenase
MVGVGGQGERHLIRLSRIEDVEIAALYDADTVRAEEVAKRFGGKAYTNFDEMLEEAGLDALYVCVPPFARGIYEVPAARRGIHLFLEKPIALSMEVAREIDKGIKEAGVISSVGQHIRYWECTAKVKKLLDGRPIGFVQGYHIGGVFGVWERVKSKSGGMLHNMGSHNIDLARYLVGEIESVYAAYGARPLPSSADFDIEQVQTLTLKFENGVVGSMTATAFTEVKSMDPFTIRRGLDIFTPDCVFQLDVARELGFGVNNAFGVLRIVRLGRVEVIVSTVDSWAVEDKIFIEAVKTGDRSAIKCSFSDAVPTYAVTLAADKSVASGKEVRISEVMAGD